MLQNIQKSLIYIKTKLLILIIILFICRAGSGTAQEHKSSFDQKINWGELSSRITQINPYGYETYEEQYLNGIIFGKPLYEYDPYTNSIVSGIEVDIFIASGSDSLKWIIVIKNGILFHDNSPLTSHDIIFSIEFYKQYITNQKKPYNIQIDNMETLTFISNTHIQINLKNKIRDIKLMLADIPIISKEYYNGGNYRNTLRNINSKDPLGYGPFFVSSPLSADKIVLIRHNKYYEKSPDFGSITIQLYAAADQMKSDFITGKLDVSQITNLDHMREISRADSSFIIISEPLKINKMIFINYNLENQILSSLNTRKALNLLYDRKTGLYTRSSFQFDVRALAEGPLPKSSWAYFDKLDKPSYEPSKARNMLNREFWRDTDRDGILERGGIEFRLELLYPENNRYFETLVRLIRTNLGQAGINIQEQPMKQSEIREKVITGDFQLALDYSNYYPQDIIRTFQDFFDLSNSEIRRNRLGQRSGEAIRALRRAANFPNQRNAKAIFEQIQDIYNEIRTSSYLIQEHHRYIAINSKRISTFFEGGRLISPAFWTAANRTPGRKLP
jgi:peptide/nickel transport system substrate-binding protein